MDHMAADHHLENMISLKSIPKRFIDSELSDFNPETIKAISIWVDDPKDFLFIHGGVGCGKTHLGCAIIKGLRKKEISSMFYKSNDIFLRLRCSFSENSAFDENDILQNYKVNRCIIFDDIGAQKISEYVLEMWYSIIDYRYNECMPTVFTSNLDIEKISQVMNDRLASRLASGIVFQLKGKDRRF